MLRVVHDDVIRIVKYVYDVIRMFAILYDAIRIVKDVLPGKCRNWLCKF